jgi:hypothetical protein
MTARPFRASCLAMGCALALVSAWVISVELLRPDMAVPFARSDTVQGLRQRLATVLFWLAPFRGDVLSHAVSLDAAPLLEGKPAAEAPPALRDRVRHVLAVAPSDSRMWLLLALLQARADAPGDRAEPLKMSYYTGPNEVALMPLRLATAARLPSAADEDLRILVQHELRLMAAPERTMRAAMLAAYRDASEAGRQLMDALIEPIDPALRAALGAEIRRR